MACHTLDFLDYALGPIRSVQGTASNQAGYYSAEDIVSGAFVFESGVHWRRDVVLYRLSELGYKRNRGSQGKVAFSSFGTDPITLTTAAGVTQFPIENPPHVQQPLIQTVVDELNGRGAVPAMAKAPRARHG